MPDLIGKQERAGFDLDFNDNAQSIITDFRDSTPVLNSLAFDSARFASAAFQTIASVPSAMVEREEVAWCIVKSYYAAFYAGHSLLRLMGESCSHFDKNHIARILALGVAYNRVPNFKLNASVYRCTLNSSASCIESRSLRDGAGGTHEVFWNVFGSRLGRVSEEVLTGPLGQIEAQNVFAKLDSLRRGLRSHGSPLQSWLSMVRNEVQYRHAHGVWMPCQVGKRDREQLGRLIGQWVRDPMEIDVGSSQGGRLGVFVLACAFVVALCRTLLTRIAERSPFGARSFAKAGPLAFIRAADMPAAASTKMA